MNGLEIAKKVVFENFDKAKFGIYNTRNLTHDDMAIVYKDKHIEISVAVDWYYYEVFGLTKEEFVELKKYYKSIGGRV